MNNLIASLNSLEEVKKYKRLEKIIESNSLYSDQMKELYELQKQMINSKHYNLEENYYIHLQKYNKLKEELENDVIVSMFLDALEEVTELLDVVTSIISNVVDKVII